MTLRRIVAAVAAALLLVPASAASASIWPAPAALPRAQAARGLVRTGSREQRITTRSCNARAKVAWWFTPVACEQTPRSATLPVTLLGG